MNTYYLRPLILTVITLFSVLGANAQMRDGILTDKEVQQIYNSKIIVGLPGDPLLDTALKEVMAILWNLTDSTTFLPEEEAIKKAKSDPRVLVLRLGETTVYSPQHRRGSLSDSYFERGYYRNVTKGQHLELRGKSKVALLKVFIPTYGDEDILTDESVYFGLSLLKANITDLAKFELKSNMKLYGKWEDTPDELRNKTLYICDEWIEDDLTIDQVKAQYNAKVKIVSFADWSKAVLEQQEGIAYNIVVQIPAGDVFVYAHYIVDAHTGEIYGVAWRKVNPVLAGKQIKKKGNSYLLNTTFLKRYVGILDPLEDLIEE